MKSFDKDHPLYKLAALFMVRLPWILAASSIPTLAFCKAKGWL